MNDSLLSRIDRFDHVEFVSGILGGFPKSREGLRQLAETLDLAYARCITDRVDWHQGLKDADVFKHLREMCWCLWRNTREGS